MTTIKHLTEKAATNLKTRMENRTSIVVQVGHCSEAVGSRKIADYMIENTGSEIDVILAGCDGACHEAPKVIVNKPGKSADIFSNVDISLVSQRLKGSLQETNDIEQSDNDFINRQQRLVLDQVGFTDPCSIDEYLVNGGYEGLSQALSYPAEKVIQEVKDSGLKGRGGAYFPAAIKWETANRIGKSPTYLIVNCEEGEPGIFKDRHIMEGIPHRLLEGAIIASYASGANKAYFYVNAEADLSADRLQKAIDQAYQYGLLGKNILSSGYSLEIEMRRGAGGYVCGDETTLLNTMEGKRREPRIKPPLPIESGFRAQPTVINNAETLSSVPFILKNGHSKFTEIGDGQNFGTKIISLSGSVKRTGLAEVPMGTSLKEIIYEIGQGPEENNSVKIIAVGGPSSGILPPSMIETPIAPGLLHESGEMLGAGGIVVLDERSNVIEVVKHLASYNANESCGKCTPCREGTPRIVEMIDDLNKDTDPEDDLNEMLHLSNIIGTASLCGLGQAAGNPVKSALFFFKEEILSTVNTQK